MHKWGEVIYLYFYQALQELGLGRRIEAMPKKKWWEFRDRIQGVAGLYFTYKNNDTVLDHHRSLAHNVVNLRKL